MGFESAYLRKWGRYQANFGLEPQLVHPQDLQRISQLTPGDRLYYCESADGDYLVLRYGDEVYRLKPDKFVIKPSPSHTFGQVVKFTKSNGVLEEGEIRHIVWHSKRDTHYYLIVVRGRLQSRWYFEEDFHQPLSP